MKNHFLSILVLMSLALAFFLFGCFGGSDDPEPDNSCKSLWCGTSCKPASADCEDDLDCGAMGGCYGGACLTESDKAGYLGNEENLFPVAEMIYGENSLITEKYNDRMAWNSNNSAGLLLYVIFSESELDPDMTIADGFARDQGRFAMELIDMPENACGPMQVKFWPINGGTAPAFSIEGERLSDVGSESVFSKAARDGDLIRAEGGNFDVPLFFDSATDPIYFRVFDAYLALDLKITDVVIEGGDFMIGGKIYLPEIIDKFDRRARTCDCAADKLDLSQPIFVTGEGRDHVQTSCQTGLVNLEDIGCSESADGFLCARLASFCEGMFLIDLLARESKNNDGYLDSVSVNISGSIATGDFIGQ